MHGRILPPALMILSFSSCSTGVWSRESIVSSAGWSMASTLTMPARESPTFAHAITSLCSNTRIPVLPLRKELIVWLAMSLLFMSTQTASRIPVYSSSL